MGHPLLKQIDASPLLSNRVFRWPMRRASNSHRSNPGGGKVNLSPDFAERSRGPGFGVKSVDLDLASSVSDGGGGSTDSVGWRENAARSRRGAYGNDAAEQPS